MDGAALLAYLETRLGINGVAQDQWDEPELLSFLTEARDDVKQALALAAPLVVQELVTLEDEDDDNKWSLPEETADPLRCIRLREVTGRRELGPSGSLDQDGGLYEWINIRQLRLTDGYTPSGGLEGFFVLHGPDIAADADESEVGLPTTVHRLMVKYAAVLALTSDEDSDATNAMGLFQRELDKIERIYGDYDGMGGGQFRQALMMMLGEQYGDSLT